MVMTSLSWGIDSSEETFLVQTGCARLMLGLAQVEATRRVGRQQCATLGRIGGQAPARTVA